MTYKQALALHWQAVVETKIGNVWKPCTVESSGRPYTHTNGRESLVFQLRTPSGNLIERYHQQMRFPGVGQ
jgi:hypothetical protein